MVSVSYAGGQDFNSPQPGDPGGAESPRLTLDDRRALVAAVRRWHDAGCCVHPAKSDGSKTPVNVQGGSPDVDANGDHGWGWGRIAHGDIPPLTVDDIASRIMSGRVDGLGIFAGPASGNLEMIEVEGRAAELLEAIRVAAIQQGAVDLLERLSHGCVERSAGGGIHFLMRVSDGPALGNLKLANRPDPTVPGGSLTLAETRGVGGWFVAAPSAGRTHKSGRRYEFVRGGPETIPTFTAAERDRLHLVFRAIDETPVVAPTTRPPVRPSNVQRTAGRGVSPGDDFAQRSSWHDILIPAGWTPQQLSGDRQHWCRPGKSSGTSATTTADVMFVFSASTGLPSKSDGASYKGLGKFGTYAHLHHGGDYSAAARDLHQQGYGWDDDDQAGGTPAVLEKPPAPSGDIRPLADYRTDLVAGVTAAVAIPGLHLFRAPTGSGKSTATATALRDVTNWLMVLPDHANVQERVADLVRAGIEAVAYPKATDDNCGNLAELNRVQRLGLVAGAVLCPSCPFKDGCKYREAVKAADDAPGRVGTHERLRRSASAAADAQVVVIDEAPEAVIAPTLTVRVEAVMQVDGLARAIRDHWYSTATDEQRLFADAMSQVVDAVNQVCIRIGGVGRTAVPLEAIGAVPDDWQRQLYRAIRQQGIDNLDADAVQLVTRAAAGDLLSLEVVTDATERTVDGDDGQQRVDRRLHHYLVGRWRPAIPAGASVIMLDATSDADNVAAVAGRPVDDRTPAGRLEGAHQVVQITDDITRGASSRTVAGIVDAFLVANPAVTRLGIIGHQPHIRDLIGADDAPGLLGSQMGRVAMSCWFGAGPDRASNRWHVDCDHVLVLGTPRINPGEYRRWLVGHGLEDAAQLEDGGWVPRPWEGTTVDGDPVVVQRGGYQDATWDRAYRATTTAALMQAVGRGRSLLTEGVPVTVITNEPLGLPIRPPVDATPAAIRETVEVVTALMAGGQPSAKSPIGNPYRGNCASALPRAQVVTALMNQLGIRRRAAQLRVVAAIAGGRLAPADQPGWVQVVGGDPQPPRMPQEALPAAPATSDTLPAIPRPGATTAVVPLPPVIEVVAPVLIAPQPTVVITTDAPMPAPDDLMDLVDERAAILEYDCGLDRLEAERRARMSYGLPPQGHLGDLKNSVPLQNTAFTGDDDQHLVVGVDHAAVAARSIPLVAAVLERFPGVVKRVMPAPRIVPRSDQPATADRCSCGCADTVAVIIHGGRSTRLDCARCDRFRRFGHWYDRGDDRGPDLPVPPSGDLRAVENNDVVRTVAAGPYSTGLPAGGSELPIANTVFPDRGAGAFPFDAIPIPGAVIGSFLPTGMG